MARDDKGVVRGDRRERRDRFVPRDDIKPRCARDDKIVALAMTDGYSRDEKPKRAGGCSLTLAVSQRWSSPKSDYRNQKSKNSVRILSPIRFTPPVRLATAKLN